MPIPPDDPFTNRPEPEPRTPLWKQGSTCPNCGRTNAVVFCPPELFISAADGAPRLVCLKCCPRPSGNATDPATIFDRIRHDPSIEGHWKALARHLRDVGEEDLAAVVRVYWRMIRECLFTPWNMTVEQALEHVRARHLAHLAERARAAEEQERADSDE